MVGMLEPLVELLIPARLIQILRAQQHRWDLVIAVYLLSSQKLIVLARAGHIVYDEAAIAKHGERWFPDLVLAFMVDDRRLPVEEWDAVLIQHPADLQLFL